MAKGFTFPRFNTLELAKRFPVAWNALPRAYREDDVLLFYVYVGDGYARGDSSFPVRIGEEQLRLEVKPEQHQIVGKITGLFNETKKCWAIRDEQGNWRNVDSKE